MQATGIRTRHEQQPERSQPQPTSSRSLWIAACIGGIPLLVAVVDLVIMTLK